jgi:hypothetical protein
MKPIKRPLVRTRLPLVVGESCGIDVAGSLIFGR